MDNDTPIKRMPRAFLYNLKTKRRSLPIRKEVYKMGKERSYVDYHIDNIAVSRHHANIVYHDDNFYIIDLNSTNHTYINGTAILPNTEIMIKNGMVIRLADTELLFKIV